MMRFLILAIFLIGCSQKNSNKNLIEDKTNDLYQDLDIKHSTIDSGSEQLRLKTTEICDDSICDIYALIENITKKETHAYKLKVRSPSKDQVKDFKKVDINSNKVFSVLNKDKTNNNDVLSYEFDLTRIGERLKIRNYFEISKCREISYYDKLVKYVTEKSPSINLHFPLAFNRDVHEQYTEFERIVLNFNFKNNSFSKISIMQAEKDVFTSLIDISDEKMIPYIIWMPEHLSKNQKLSFGRSMVTFAVECDEYYDISEDTLSTNYIFNPHYSQSQDEEPSKELNGIVRLYERLYGKTHFTYVTSHPTYNFERTEVYFPEYEYYKNYFNQIKDPLKEQFNEAF